MAHGTTETLQDEGVQKVAEGDRVKDPRTWWEQQCTLETAKRLLADTKSMVVEMNKAAGHDEYPLEDFGGTTVWVGHA